MHPVCPPSVLDDENYIYLLIQLNHLNRYFLLSNDLFGYDSVNTLTLYSETLFFMFFSQWKKMSDTAEMKVEEILMIS